jgi:hypothetical protein
MAETGENHELPKTPAVAMLVTLGDRGDDRAGHSRRGEATTIHRQGQERFSG